MSLASLMIEDIKKDEIKRKRMFYESVERAVNKELMKKDFNFRVILDIEDLLKNRG